MIRRYRWTLVIVLTLAVVACGGDDAPQSAGTVPTVTPTAIGENPTPTATERLEAATATTEPTQTPEPTEAPPTPTLTLEPTTMPTEEPEPTPSPEPPIADITDADMEQYLLTLQDMPLGWTFQPQDDEEDESDPEDETTAFCGAPRPDNLSESVASADANLQVSSRGPLLNHQVNLYPDEDTSKGFMDWARNRYACGEWTVVDTDGTETPLRFSPLAFPNVGDDTFVVRISMPGGILGDIEVDVVHVRVGAYVTQIQHFGFGGVDTQLTLNFIETAVAKLPQ